MIFVGAILVAIGVFGSKLESAKNVENSQDDRQSKHKKAQKDRDKKQEELKELINSKQLVCDRDKTQGCKLPFKHQQKFGFTDNTGKRRTSALIDVSAGGKKESYTILTMEANNKDHPGNKEIRFPKLKGKKISPPFVIKKVEDKLLFEGEIFDYKDGAILGWFNGEEFGVVKPCAFSWNKDERGIEIIDRYNNVVFSMEYNPYTKGLKYRGFFKIDESFYIFNEEDFTILSDVSLAEKKIKEIEKYFNHYGTSILGDRIKNPRMDFSW